MKDLLNEELKIKDVVAYISATKGGKVSAEKGIVIGFNNKGAKVLLGKKTVNVKNVIKMQNRFNLLSIFKKNL